VKTGNDISTSGSTLRIGEKSTERLIILFLFVDLTLIQIN